MTENEGFSRNKIMASFRDHLSLVKECEQFSGKIYEMKEALLASISSGKTIFWYGNGGSAADSQHMAAELVSRFKLERRGISSIALSTDTSILTAIGNDYAFDKIFERQVEALVRPGDVCIGLSTSGNSKNVYSAHKKAQAIGATTLSLLGCDGGVIDAASDLSIVVPSNDTPRIQEVHTLVSHIICDLVEVQFAANEAKVALENA